MASQPGKRVCCHSMCCGRTRWEWVSAVCGVTASMLVLRCKEPHAIIAVLPAPAKGPSRRQSERDASHPRCGFGVDKVAELSFNRGRFGGSAMRKRALLGFLCVLLIATGQVRGEDLPPAWAYPVNPPDFKPTPDDGRPRQVADSSASYSVAQTRDRFLAPDWHPTDHPAMPEIVAKGRKPDVFACGFCHRANGSALMKPVVEALSGQHACTGGLCSVAAAGSRRKTMSWPRGCIERQNCG